METIIWIDDDTDVINSVIHPLEREYKVIRINTVKEALDNIETIKSSVLIILDMILPSGKLDLDMEQPAGYSLLKRLRKEFDVWQPVIILSVLNKEKVTGNEDFELMGVQDVLRKPIRPSTLKSSVDSILRK